MQIIIDEVNQNNKEFTKSVKGLNKILGPGLQTFCDKILISKVDEIGPQPIGLKNFE